MFIYKITNKINGKSYIGQTTKTIEKRFKQHYRNKKATISKAMKKYGIDNFKIEEIDGANNITELNYKEWLLIHRHNTMSPNGYNMMQGGGSKGKLSKISKEKLKKSIIKFHKQKTTPYTISKAVINTKTGEIYQSAKDCWRKNKIKTTYSGFQQKLLGDIGNETPFRYVGMEDVFKKPTKSGYSNRKRVVNTKTGEIYNSLKECAKINNIESKLLSLKLLGKTGNETPFRYVGMEDVCKKWVGLSTKKDKGLKVINTKTGEIYKTIRECAKKNKIGYTRFSQKMSGKLKNNTIFKYLEE